MSLFSIISGVTSRLVELKNQTSSYIANFSHTLRQQIGRRFPNFGLHIATEWGDTEMAVSAISAGVNVNSTNPLASVFSFYSVVLTGILLTLDTIHQTDLMVNEAYMRYFIAIAGVAVYQYGYTPIARAKARGNETVYALLINENADPHLHNAHVNQILDVLTYPMFFTLKVGYQSYLGVSSLISRGATMVKPATRSTRIVVARIFPDFALHFSARWGDEMMARAAINSGADLNGRNLASGFLNKMLFLHITSELCINVFHYIYFGNMSGLAFPIIIYGATVSINAAMNYRDGYSPLSKSLRAQHPKVVKLLIEKGATITHLKLGGAAALLLSEPKALSLVQNSALQIVALQNFYKTWNMQPVDNPDTLDKEIMEGRAFAREVVDFLNGNLDGALPPDSDPEVIAAHKHFEEKIQPQYGEYYSQQGDTNEKCLEVIECKIRETILDYIERENKQDVQTINFIKEHKPALIRGDKEALRRSVPFFRGRDIAYSAWRGYNLYAPVSGSWENLLTAPTVSRGIYTTPAATANMGVVTNTKASNLVRERIAHYYLHVTDMNVDSNNINNRIANFILQLSVIRNANGLDDPSCFPGTLSRIANMGRLNQNASLDASTPNHVYIHGFFQSRIVRLFKEFLQECQTPEERQTRYYAIVGMTRINAYDIAFGKESSYTEEHAQLRTRFAEMIAGYHINATESIVTIPNGLSSLLDEFKRENPGVTLSLTDHFSVIPYFVEPTRNGILQALTTVYQSYDDVLIADEDLHRANPFIRETDYSNWSVFEMLFQIAVKMAPVRTVRELNDRCELIQSKVVKITHDQFVTKPLIANMIRYLDPDNDGTSIVEQLLNQFSDRGYPLKKHNPFSEKVINLEKLVERYQNQAQIQSRYLSLLRSEQRKMALFERATEIFTMEDEFFIERFVYALTEKTLQEANAQLSSDDCDIINHHGVALVESLLGIDFVVNQPVGSLIWSTEPQAQVDPMHSCSSSNVNQRNLSKL